MAKAVIRNLLAHTGRATGYLASMEREAMSQLNILCYHRIMPDADKAAYFSPDLVVTPEAFHLHCETLARHYTVLPVSEAIALFEQGGFDKPIVALTFDDGYLDNLLYAAPVLKEFGLRATFYVVSGLVGTKTPPWYDVLAKCVQELNAGGESLDSVKIVEDAKSLTPQERKDLVTDYCSRLDGGPTFRDVDLLMNPTQLKQLSADGHEIGSHSISHEILPLLDDAALKREVHDSKKQLESILDKKVTSFCYPNGDYDSRTIETVKASGYENATSVHLGANTSVRDRYTLKRRYIHEQRLAGVNGKASSTTLRAEISGLNDRLLRRKAYPHTPGQKSQKRNILTIAVEDYFQATALKPLVKEKQWGFLESRVEINTRRTLDFLDKYGHSATFFVLGRVADEMPELVREIIDRGHEVSSKGYEAHDLHEMSRNDFRDDVLRARNALESATGVQVLGHRIAKGHLGTDDVWALDTLAELGFAYDSSVFPRFRSAAREPWRRFPHFHRSGNREILELPLSTWGVGGMLIPVAGGNYMRQLPPQLMQKAVAHWVESYESPFNMYFHVWELDPDLPKIASAGWLRRIRQYRNLRHMPRILGHYLERYRFESIASYLNLKAELINEQTPLKRRVKPISLPAPDLAAAAKTLANLTPVTVILPCFNEERVLPYLARVLDSLRLTLGKRYNLQFLFVDDGSTDATFHALEELFGKLDDCTLVRHGRNVGIAGAILTGIEHATTEIICSIDCDGSYDPHQLELMIPLLHENVAMVTASPYHPLGEAVGVPHWRLSLSRGLSSLYRRVLTHKFATYTSCFRVYRKSAMQDFKLKNRSFLGVVEMCATLDAQGANLVECPAVLEARILGHSKMKTLRTILGHLGLLVQVIFSRMLTRLQNPKKSGRDA
ncbi:MAG: polysaccharide deacetylase family protein [Planctomycetota bacterium]